MTGQKDRYTTTEKLLRLDDETLTSPKHDEMILWSLNKYNILPLVKFKNNQIEPSLILTLKDKQLNVNVRLDIYKKGYENLLDDLKNKTHIHKHNNIIESNWYKIVDDYNIIKKDIDYVIDNWIDFVKVESEIPIVTRNEFIVGYLDIKISMDDFVKVCGMFIIKYTFSQIENCYIEIKPYISSFGQTLRQIKTYQNYLPIGDFYLFTPDKKFKKAFESQGIKVLIYPNK